MAVMGRRQASRGPHPKDLEAFATRRLPTLRRAAADYCWLLGRGYPPKASLGLVGDRHRLLDRQRRALQRCAAPESAVAERRSREVAAEGLAGRELVIDGYNVLLTVEAALAGGVVLVARDGTLRDLASLSRHFRQVGVTAPALERIGGVLAALELRSAHWLFDAPISNSGRLATRLRELAEERSWPWRVDLVRSADPHLRDSEETVATADSAVLDRCGPWFNLARVVVEREVARPWIVDLSGV